MGKKATTCGSCGKEKRTQFRKGICGACYVMGRKRTAICTKCGVEKHSQFTVGMCSPCYAKSKKKTAVCTECREEKYASFTSGMCNACYSLSRKKTAICGRCGEERYGRFTNGVCNPCYQKSPQVRAMKNAWAVQREREDEAFRLANRIACGIRSGLSGKKNARTLELIGCTHEELLAHFQATDHEGCGDNPHIGHILVPKSWATRFAGDEGVAFCFQLANLAYQNPDENRRLQDNPWYDCPFINSETIAVAKKFLAITGTDEPELAELAAFIEVYESAAV